MIILCWDLVFWYGFYMKYFLRYFVWTILIWQYFWYMYAMNDGNGLYNTSRRSCMPCCTPRVPYFLGCALRMWNLPSITFIHVHYLIIRLDIQWISNSHIGILHTSTHEKLSNSFSFTKIMNHVGQLKSYSIYIIPSRSHMTLP